MSLTANDLQQIKTVVNEVVNEVVQEVVHDIVNDAVNGSEARLRAELGRFATKDDLRNELDRTESRLTAAMSLLQRDTFSHLSDHEARITRLEQSRA